VVLDVEDVVEEIGLLVAADEENLKLLQLGNAHDLLDGTTDNVEDFGADELLLRLKDVADTGEEGAGEDEADGGVLARCGDLDETAEGVTRVRTNRQLLDVLNEEEHVTDDDDPIGRTDRGVDVLVEAGEGGETTVEVRLFGPLRRVRVELLDERSDMGVRRVDGGDRLEGGDNLETSVASFGAGEEGGDDLAAAVVERRRRLGTGDGVQGGEDLEEVRLDPLGNRLVRLAEEGSDEGEEVRRLLLRVDIGRKGAEEGDLALGDLTLRIEVRGSDGEKTTKLDEEDVDAGFDDGLPNLARLSSILNGELNDVSDEVEDSKDDRRLDVADGEDAVKGGEEGGVVVDEELDEVATEAPGDEELEEGGGCLSILGSEGGKTRRNEGGKGGGDEGAVVEVNLKTEEVGETLQCGLANVAERRKRRLVLLLDLLVLLLLILYLLNRRRLSLLRRSIETLLSEVKEVENGTEQIRPPSDEILAKVLEDVGEESEETELTLAGDVRRLRGEAERFPGRGDEELAKRTKGEVDEGVELVGGTSSERTEHSSTTTRSSLTGAGAGATETGGHDPVGDADEEGDDLLAMRRVESAGVCSRDKLKELVAKLGRLEKVLETSSVGGDGGSLPSEETLERELLDLKVGEGEEGAELRVEIRRPVECLRVAQLREKPEPGDEAKLAVLRRLVDVEVLRSVLRSVGNDIVSGEATEEDLDEVAVVPLCEVGNGAEEGEEVGFVGLDDETFGGDLPL
jgi:hypothetical protein